MKFISFRSQDGDHAGLVEGLSVIPLHDPATGEAMSLKSLIVTCAGNGGIERYLDRGRPVPLDAVEMVAPITDPGKIICVGTNYETHRLETGRDKTARPPIFARFPESVVGCGAPLVCPPETAMFDFEGEIAVVIGKAGRRIPRQTALDHVFGYSCFNDGSVRDWQRHTHQWMPGKNFDGTASFGPLLVTKDEAGPPEKMHLITRLNGETMQDAFGDQMIFSVPEIIEYVSTFATLKPGDVIASGTPGGVGAMRDPKVFMKTGDLIEIEVSGLGRLSNRIAAE